MPYIYSMNKNLFLLIVFAMSLNISLAQGYQVGDKATDFHLRNVDGQWISMADYPEAKGFVIIFTCNHCPYSKAYESRINNLAVRYSPLGYPVIAINPNDSTIVPADSYSQMKIRAKKKNFHFPYLLDDHQKYTRIYGATRIPHVFILQKQGNNLIVRYIGAIDDNYMDALEVSKHFVQNAINALLHGKNPKPDFTKAIGCTIKYSGETK